MGFFDIFKKAAATIPGAQTVIAEVSEVQQAVNPPELANMEQQVGVIKQKITALGQGLAQNMIQPHELTDLRISVMGHYIHLHEGGDPAPTDPLTKARIEAMPQFQAMKNEYPTLAQSLADLEKQYQLCTYGYKMADGSILVPDVSWTTEQWQQIREQSVDKTARCWLDADTSQSAT